MAVYAATWRAKAKELGHLGRPNAKLEQSTAGPWLQQRSSGGFLVGQGVASGRTGQGRGAQHE